MRMNFIFEMKFSFNRKRVIFTIESKAKTNLENETSNKRYVFSSMYITLCFMRIERMKMFDFYEA